MSRTWTTVFAIALAFSANRTAAASLIFATSSTAATAFAQPPSTAHVRSTNAAIVALIAEGLVRSATFAALVADIEWFRGVVYVEFGLCAFGHVGGCVLPVVGGPGEDRSLRVIIMTPKKPRDRVLALLARELRHALEVFEHHEVVDAASLDAMYRRIGSPANIGGSGYETLAATAVGEAVRKELSLPTATAHGYAVDTSAGTSRTIDGAVTLLPADLQARMPPVAVLRAPDEKKRRRQQPVVEARVFPGDSTIYVNAWGSAFRDAENGKRAALAAALAHEQWHQEHGPDEAGAYDQQLAVLRSLHAPKDLVQRVEYARELAVWTQQHQRQHAGA
jgi:hypothetical protein